MLRRLQVAQGAALRRRAGLWGENAMHDKSLCGTVAIVTGAGSVSADVTGIGTVIARELLAAGATVGGLDWHADGLAQFAAQCADLGYGDRFLPVQCDVSSFVQCAAAVHQVTETLGAPTVLFNHAGIGESDLGEGGLKRFWETDLDNWERVLRVNVAGPFMMARLVLPGMLAGGWGRIINTATSFQTMLDPYRSGYGPSKAALEAHSAIWAKELKDTGVTVNCLLPGGMVATNSTARLGVDMTKLLSSEIFGPPAVWLASRDSDGVTGRRFVAREWGADIDPAAAAARQDYPIGWPGLGPGRTVDPLLGSA
jgi:NAD(P)-dependent dehydrogenase (short-subunit alcohol dehydrogenase family)